MKKNIRASLLPHDRKVASKDCQTCKKRRIKCDRSMPSCEKCAIRHITCPGYVQSRFQWRPPAVLGNACVAKRGPRSTAILERPWATSSSPAFDSCVQQLASPNPSSTQDPALVLSKENLSWADRFAAATLSSRLLDHFIHDTARRLVWLDNHSNPWRAQIWPLSKESPLLRLCLMTVATAHIAAMSGSDVDNQIYQASRDASIRALSHNINNSMVTSMPHATGPVAEEFCTELAVAIVAVCYGDLFTKHTPQRAVHLRACDIAIDTGLLLQKRKGPLNETLQFAMHEANDLLTTANVFALRENRPLTAPIILNKKESFWTFTAFIHDVTAAERQLHIHRTSKHTPAAINIESWISKLDLAKRSLLDEDLSDRDCVRHHGRGSSLRYLIDMNYFACLIYLFQSLSPSNMDDTRPQSATVSLLESIRAITNDFEFFEIFGHDVYWPLFIAGTASWAEPAAQERVTQLFMRAITKTGFWCNHDALQFLKAFWAEGAILEHDQKNWLDFARKRQCSIPSFIVY